MHDKKTSRDWVRHFLPLLRPFRKQLCAAALAMVVDALVSVFRPWPLKIVIDRVLSHKPSRVPRHAEGARAFRASVKLCEYRPSLRHVQGIVAQYVALAGVVADRGDGVPAGPGLIWCHISRRVSDREQLVHVSRI